MTWAFRNVGSVSTAFNASTTPGAPASIVNGDLMIIASTEFLGTDAAPVISGWTNITLSGTTWVGGSSVYAKIASGNDPMPTIPSWGNQWQASVCLVYSGGPLTITGLVDTHSVDKRYTSNNILSFNATSAPTNDNSLIVAISFKNTNGAASPTFTETGGLVGFNRRVTQWPNAQRPTIVIDDLIQGGSAPINSPGMNMSFTESAAQSGQSAIFIFNPVIIATPAIPSKLIFVLP